MAVVVVLLAVACPIVCGCTASPAPAAVPPPGQVVAPAAVASATASKAAQPQDATATGPHRELQTEWYANGMKKLEGWTVDGRRDGVWRAWYDSGFKSWEGRYEDGKVQGTWSYWLSSGRLGMERDFVADDLRCWRQYQTEPPGRLRWEQSFLHGQQDGASRIFRNGVWETSYWSRGMRIDDPSTANTADALGHRLKHETDASRRAEAARQLAGIQPVTEGMIADLVLGLEDPEPRVVRECVTTLGIAGAAAAAAIPRLEEVAQGDDRTLAEVARSSVRRIRGDMAAGTHNPVQGRGDSRR
jgi:hypothetical protein